MAQRVTAEDARKLVRRDLNELAPRMREAVTNAIDDCARAGHDVEVYEALRTDELARMYFQLGASRAPNALSTWHYYALAVDVIHPEHGWDWWDGGGDAGKEWRDVVVAKFKGHGLHWGGDWVSFVDKPHFQWGACPASPDLQSKDLVRTKGRAAVWDLWGANEAAPAPTASAHPLLRLGDRGADVKLLQARLSVTPVSGLFGPITRAAVVAFQKAHGLEADGIVGAQTWQALGI